MAIRASLRSALLALAVALATAATGETGAAPAASPRYVAMGSSFAAGPGSGPLLPESGRCARSVSNYPNLLAERLGMELIDVSCSGATIDHLIGPWNELAAQIDAVTMDTALVTITIGGNDLGYIGGLIIDACEREAAQLQNVRTCPARPENSDSLQQMQMEMIDLFRQVRARAPVARIIVVDYLAVLPQHATCRALGLSREEARRGKRIAAALASSTRLAAHIADIELVPVSKLLDGGHACAAQPLVAAWYDDAGARNPVPFHPNAAGMKAIAELLAAHLQ